jgi:hypothetical protein
MGPDKRKILTKKKKGPLPGNCWRDAQDSLGNTTSARSTVWRWREAFQADFQARLDWCVTREFAKANHNPIAVLNGDKSRGIVHLQAQPGETVQLSAKESHDPDGDGLQIRWFVYREAGRDSHEIKLSHAEGFSTSFTAPKGNTPRTVHVILEVRDDGTPPLRGFRRAVIHIPVKQ